MNVIYPYNLNAELRRIVSIAKNRHTDEATAKEEIREIVRRDLRLLLAKPYLDRIYNEYS